MMNLTGGEKITIVRDSNNLHTFTRAQPGLGAHWVLTTPMSARQRRKLAPEEPRVDVSALSLEERMRHAGGAMRRRRRRNSVINNRVRGIDSANDETIDLGHGIHPVKKALLFQIFDGVVAVRGSGASIDVDELNRFVTSRRGGRQK